MKINFKGFSFKEKIVLLVLSILLVCFVYYYFVSIPVRDGIAEANSEKEALEIELNGVNTKLQQYNSMEKEMENTKASYMLSYNGKSKETKLLNDIFSETDEYDISFQNADVTREGSLIRRPFSAYFTTSSVTKAESILKKLINSEYRCEITDVDLTTENTNNGVTVRLNAIFYETMVGGKEDAALPEDSTLEQDALVDEDSY